MTSATTSGSVVKPLVTGANEARPTGSSSANDPAESSHVEGGAAVLARNTSAVLFAVAGAIAATL